MSPRIAPVTPKSVNKNDVGPCDAFSVADGMKVAHEDL